MDPAIRRIEPTRVRPTGPRRRRGRDEDVPFELDASPSPEPGADENARPPEGSDRAVAPRPEDEPGAHLDLSA